MKIKKEFMNKQIENLLEIGDEIIANHANEEETESIEKVRDLDQIESFVLGAALIYMGYEVNQNGCELVLDKGIKIMGVHRTPKFIN